MTTKVPVANLVDESASIPVLPTVIVTPTVAVPLQSGWKSRTLMVQIAGMILAFAVPIGSFLESLPLSPTQASFLSAGIAALTYIATAYLKLYGTATVAPTALRAVQVQDAVAKADVIVARLEGQGASVQRFVV